MLELPKSIPKRVGLFGLTLGFGFAGSLHFTSPEAFVAIVPPYLPAPLALVYISGACEVLGALGVLLARTRVLAGYGLIALLIAAERFLLDRLKVLPTTACLTACFTNRDGLCGTVLRLHGTACLGIAKLSAPPPRP